MAALSIEQVLAEEAEAIAGTAGLAKKLLADLVAAQDAAAKVTAAANAHDAEQDVKVEDVKTARYRLDADRRSGEDIPAAEVSDRKAFYRSLNALNRAALCCSGGGIRSATFCLGVIQALAAHDVGALTHKPADKAPPEAGKTQSESKAEHSLLGCFHYLSTVSGGGYVGSWLSSWLKRNTFNQVIENLTGRPSGPDVEPAEISWLRAYSNYLTPQLGITSADAWAAVAIFSRNLILNWLIIIPVVGLALLALKLTATVSTWVAHNVDNPWGAIAVVLVGAVCLIVAQAFTNNHRPTRRAPHGNAAERAFLWHDLAWAIASAILLTVFFVSHYFVLGFKDWTASIVSEIGLAGVMGRLGIIDVKFEFLLLTAAGGMLTYAVGWIAGRRFGKGAYDVIAWTVSGAVYGALVGLGAYLFSTLGPYQTIPYNVLSLLLSFIFGVPWMLMSQLAAEIIFVGLVSYEADSDADREWLGCSAGWLAAAAIGWTLIAFLVFAGEYVVYAAHIISVKALALAGGVSGIATALLGMSSSTPATSTSDNQGGVWAIASNIALAVAGPVFAAALVVGLSIGLDRLLLGDWLVALLQTPTRTTSSIIGWLAGGLVVTAVVGAVASYFVNINRFSLHALYRNRLIRGYLAASRQERDPDLFTGFDIKDNIHVHDLWPPQSRAGAGAHSLFHVINIAHNVVSTKRLSWQERKAESFTVRPKHCGSAYLGFRPSDEYGEREGKGGITLGTAMAISGAAASPKPWATTPRRRLHCCSHCSTSG